MKPLLAAVTLAVASAPAFADVVVLTAPGADGVLREDRINMALSWTDGAGGPALVATYLTDPEAAPNRIVLHLQDGDNVTYGLPGAPGYHFSFARAGDAVLVASRGYGAPGSVD